MDGKVGVAVSAGVMRCLRLKVVRATRLVENRALLCDAMSAINHAAYAPALSHPIARRWVQAAAVSVLQQWRDIWMAFSFMTPLFNQV